MKPTTPMKVELYYRIDNLERENADLKRRLEGAHVNNCVCDPQGKVSLDPRCDALRTK